MLINQMIKKRPTKLDPKVKFKDFRSLTEMDYNLDAINNSIRNILTTPRGTTPGKVSHGSRINDTVFMFLDYTTISMLQNFITESLQMQEPRIHLKTVDVKSSPESNLADVFLEYSYKVDGTQLEGSLSFPVQGNI